MSDGVHSVEDASPVGGRSRERCDDGSMSTTGHDSSRVAWITGAGSGIGEAVARRAASAGWTVVLSGRRAEQLDRVAAAVASEGGTALAVPLDVTDPDAVATAHAAVTERFARVDALVLAAGLNSPRRSWADQRMSDFERIVETNLTAPVQMIDVVLPQLRAAGGVVVLVSSYAAWSPGPGAGVAYSASKRALGEVARTLNAEEAASGVRACHLCPGEVATDFLDQRPQVPDTDARALMLVPDDVASAVQFVLDAPPHVRVDELVISPTARR